MQLNHLLDTSHKTDYSTYYYIGVENNNHVDMKSTSVNTWKGEFKLQSDGSPMGVH